MNDDLINRISAEYENEINKTFDDVCEMLPIVCEQIRLTMSLKVGNPWVIVRFKQLCRMVNAHYWLSETSDGLYICVCDTEGNVKGLRV